MGMLDTVKRFLALEPMQERTIDPLTAAPDMATQLAALRAHQAQARPWRLPSITAALGVPAILRAVTLIANTTGSLALQGIRDGLPMVEAPRILTRPDPFRTPQEAYRDMAWAMATRGETVLWIAARDYNDTPLSLVVVPLAELTVEENPRNRLYPIYTWNGARSTVSTRYSSANPSGDFVHVTFAKLSPLDLRGVGPLQLCGAATSVSVEAQEWAANFFASGGYPSVVLQSEIELDGDEANTLKAQWTSTPPNMPKVTGPGLTFAEFGANPQGAQMMQARDYQNGDAARMFGMPGSLLDYSTPGSSLTYQNLEGEFGKFVRGCLAPNYLAPIEQALSDLLPRSVIARFYVDGLLRADVKTRYEVYASGITSGVLTVEEARTKEGLAPGNIETSVTPAAPPAAVPASIPMQGRSAEEPWRCTACGKKLAETQGYGTQIRCRCGTMNEGLEPLVREQAASVVNVTSPPVSIVIEAGAIVSPPVSVDARTTFERGAIETPVNVTSPDVHVDASMQPGAVVMRPPDITITNRAATMPADTEQGEAIAERLAGIEERLRPRVIDKQVLRDDKGRIIGVRETEEIA